MSKRRHLARRAAQQRGNADAARLPLTDYLALPRRERKRRARRARETCTRKGDADA